MFAKGAYWLIALGIVGALVAALVGFLDLFAIPTGTKAFRIGLVAHDAQPGRRQPVRRVVPRPPVDIDAPGEVSSGLIALSAVALGLLGVSGWLGGTLSFRYGVRVADETTQATGFDDEGGALMEVAALITWVLTALGGFVMLGIWLPTAACAHARDRSSAFPAGVLFGHFLLAAVGLVVWIIFVVSDDERRPGVDGVRHPARPSPCSASPCCCAGWPGGRAGACDAASAAPEQRFPAARRRRPRPARRHHRRPGRPGRRLGGLTIHASSMAAVGGGARRRRADAQIGVDEDAGVHHAGRVDGVLGGRSAAAKRSGRWRSYCGRCMRPTAWWWVIVPPASSTASLAAALISAHCDSSEPC